MISSITSYALAGISVDFILAGSAIITRDTDTLIYIWNNSENEALILHRGIISKK